MRKILSYTEVPAVMYTAMTIVIMGFALMGLKVAFGIDVLSKLT